MGLPSRCKKLPIEKSKEESGPDKNTTLVFIFRLFGVNRKRPETRLLSLN